MDLVDLVQGVRAGVEICGVDRKVGEVYAMLGGPFYLWSQSSRAVKIERCGTLGEWSSRLAIF